MSKRDEFIQVVNTFKNVSPSITNTQRRELLKRAVQIYDLSVDDASEILKSWGLIVGEEVDYFEVLGISIEEIQGLDDQTIVNIIETAHDQCYRASLRAGARIRPDGKTEDQWRNILNQARDTLGDTQKRHEYLTIFHEDALEEISPSQDQPLTENDLQDAEPTPSNSSELTVPSTETDVILIPAGEFQMGSQAAEENGTEIRVKSIFVDAFLINKYPITNAQYKIFLDANPQWEKNRIIETFHDGNYLQTWSGSKHPRGKADYPVVDVSWYAAMAYAQWVGKRLPTEAEWEKAARGGLIGKIYPWGDQISLRMANYGMHIGKTTPVGNYPPNDYGIYDMVGNVWEWCLDEYDDNFSRRNPGLTANSIREITKNFLGIEASRVLRGGSWASSERAVQVGYCGWAAPNFTYYSYGFRCVRDITP